MGQVFFHFVSLNSLPLNCSYISWDYMLFAPHPPFWVPGVWGPSRAPGHPTWLERGHPVDAAAKGGPTAPCPPHMVWVC